MNYINSKYNVIPTSKIENTQITVSCEAFNELIFNEPIQSKHNPIIMAMIESTINSRKLMFINGL